MKLRYRRAAVLLTLVVVAGTAAAVAAATPTLTGEMMQSFFQPCPTVQGPNGYQVCTTPTVEPAHVQAQCNPNGSSTMSLDTTGVAFGPINGTAEIHVSITVGKQDQAPVPIFQPFPTSGATAGTIGLASGPLTTFQERFSITSFDGLTTAVGTKTLVADLGNTGVCATFQDQQPPNNPYLGAPLTGYFYIANAQVLSYQATITDPTGTYHEAGVSEAYLSNTFGRFTFAPDSVASSNGHFVQSFGTSRPLGPPPNLKPGLHCGDKNHVGEREGDCKNPPK